jgi:hypothetical protein
MTRVARLVGLIVFGLAVAELVLTIVADLQGQIGPIPPWNGWAWTSPLRAGFEYASFAGLAVVGLIMARKLDWAIVPLGAAILVAAARIGYDWLFWRAGGPRLEELLRSDLNFAVIATIGLFACLVAQDEAAALAARKAPGAAPAD